MEQQPKLPSLAFKGQPESQPNDEGRAESPRQPLIQGHAQGFIPGKKSAQDVLRRHEPQEDHPAQNDQRQIKYLAPAGVVLSGAVIHRVSLVNDAGAVLRIRPTGQSNEMNPTQGVMNPVIQVTFAHHRMRQSPAISAV